MNESWLSVFSSPNVHWVLLGTMLLGLTSGILSVFAVLRQQSLLGDVVAHAALPGICLSYLLFGVKSVPLFLGGALLSGLLAGFLIQLIVNQSKLRHDAALAIVLSVFFGFGLMLLTYIQQLPNGNQAGIDRFLFGQAASLVLADVRFIALSAVLIGLLVLLFFKQLKTICFDASFAASIGMPVKSLHFLITALIVVIVITGIQIAGVVLVAALLITPALSARYWSKSLTTMVWLSALFGSLAGLLGTATSAVLGDIPTGPVIILYAALIFVLSAIFAPRKGWLAL
jgi:manganese/zinc/iron transport system permease protein